MAHAQSKMIQEEYYEEEDNYVQDKLVLYIEECDEETKCPDMRCFIIFDEYENEYLINGMRKDSFVVGEQHKFYCKKRKNVLNYLKSILDPKNEVKIILYNYSNLSYYKLNFKELYSLGNNKKEVVGYDGVNLLNETSWDFIKMHLKNLKFVRY